MSALAAFEGKVVTMVFVEHLYGMGHEGEILYSYRVKNGRAEQLCELLDLPSSDLWEAPSVLAKHAVGPLVAAGVHEVHVPLFCAGRSLFGIELGLKHFGDGSEDEAGVCLLDDLEVSGAYHLAVLRESGIEVVCFNAETGEVITEPDF